VIVQHDCFDGTDPITVCAFTSDNTEMPLFRLPTLPKRYNGLRGASRLMLDKITTVSMSTASPKVGRLDDEHLHASIRRCQSFSGLAVFGTCAGACGYASDCARSNPLPVKGIAKGKQKNNVSAGKIVLLRLLPSSAEDIGIQGREAWSD
jgi:mRNA interferase MazF